MPDKPVLPPQMYGIWLPGQGWWKLSQPGGNAVAYATLRKEEAQYFATWVSGAKVVPIDISLTNGERELLQSEKDRAERTLQYRSRKLWDTFKKLLHSRAS